MKKALLTLAGTVLLAGNLNADPFVEGDAEAGQAKSITCTACHGPDGNSVNPTWPSIAGQHPTYFVEQLKAFKSGSRSDPLMMGQVIALTEEDMNNLAVYYADNQPALKTVPDPSLVDRGRRIYLGGNNASSTAACIACHGPTGRGNPASAVPAISGQYAVYTVAQLEKYANGERTSDGPTRVMRDIATTLSDDDIEAVAAYMQGLH